MNIRGKGSGGEREFCEWLQIQFCLDKKPKRNLEQIRDGGADVIFPPFMFEVKRCQTILHTKWWMQVVKAASTTGLIAVVAYRQNNKQWEFLISATEIGADKGFLHINRFVFLNWALTKRGLHRT